MQYDFTAKGFAAVMNGIISDTVTDKAVRKAIRKEYKAIVLRAEDIGKGNTLMFAYLLAAYFIAMNRNDGLTPEKNEQLLERNMRKSKLLKIGMGSSKGYFSEKHMEMRRKWSKQTHERKYKNDWVVDVLEKTEDYQFGFDYTECGVCKLCRDEGCFELAKYLCALDFMMVDIIGIKLKRTTTLAEGGDRCDFRFIGK